MSTFKFKHEENNEDLMPKVSLYILYLGIVLFKSFRKCKRHVTKEILCWSLIKTR